MSLAPAAAAPRPAPLELLKERNFRRIWLAGALSGVMRWLDQLAVAVYVLDVSGSALVVAMTLFLRMFPMFLFGAAVGAVAETVDRRVLLIANLLVLAVVYAVLSWLAVTGQLQLWQLALGVFLSGVFWAFDLPLRRTMIAEIAGMERIGATMGLESSTNNFTRMLGPFTGGLLYEAFGLPGTLILGTGLYLLSAALLARVAYQGAPARTDRPSFLRNVAEGFRFVRGNPVILATLCVTVSLNIFGFSYVSMVPVVAREALGLSPFPTGILMSAEGCGAFIGALLIAFRASAARFRQIYVGGTLLYLTCIFLFGASSWFWLSLPLVFVGGFGVAGFAVMQSALLIADSPPEMRNRVMGLMAMCIGIGPIGILFVGALAEQMGAAPAIMVTSAIGLATMAAIVLRWPAIRQLRPLD